MFFSFIFFVLLSFVCFFSHDLFSKERNFLFADQIVDQNKNEGEENPDIVSLVPSEDKESEGSFFKITVNAGEVIHDEKTKIFHLKENVEIHFKGYYISCEEALIFTKTSQIQAKGNVTFRYNDLLFKAKEMDFNYLTLAGAFYNFKFKLDKILIEGEKLEKKEGDIYLIKGGKYTSCSQCPPLLSFSSSSLKVDLKRGLSMKSGTIRIFDKPFFYFPYFFFPLQLSEEEFQNNSRFLLPQFDITELGVVFSESLLLDLSKNQDLILTGRYYSERGFKAAFHHLYMADENNYGRFEGALIRDLGFNPKFRSRRSEPSLRGYMKYKHYYTLPFIDVIQRVSLNKMTDLHYHRDYPDELGFHGEGSLENRISITKNFETHHISAELGFYTNLLKRYAFENNKDAVHRFPEIHYSLLEREIGNTNIYYKLDVNYVNFFRNSHSYDDVVYSSDDFSLSKRRDGRFDYTIQDGFIHMDQIRTGHRLHIQPEIFYFFSLFDKVRVKPFLSYRDFLYRFYPFSHEAEEFGYKRNARQQVLNIGLSSAMRFYAFFHLLGVQYKHIMKPEVTYQDASWFKLSDHPFFGHFELLPFSQELEPVSDADFFSRNKRIQFDYNDRVYDHHFLKFSLHHRVIQKKVNHQNNEYKDVLILRTEQAFDLNNYKKITSQPWTPLRNTLRLSLDRFHIQQTWDYFYYSGVSSLDSRIYMEDFKKRFIQLGYQKSFVIKEDNSYDHQERTEDIKTALGFASRYLDFAGELTYSLVTKALQKWSYVLTLRFPGDCFSVHFKQSQEVGVRGPYFKVKLNYQL